VREALRLMPPEKAPAAGAPRSLSFELPAAGQVPVGGAEIREEKKKPQPAARTRQAAAKSPRKKPAPPAAAAPAGTVGREAVPRKAEQVESGEVIDFMLKKRSGQR